MKQYNVGYPLERDSLDLMGPLPRTNVNNSRYVLLVSCYFTKWLDAIPLATTDTKTIATKLIERFIPVLGVLTQLHSDQVSMFESTVFKKVCKLLGIHKTRTRGRTGLVVRVSDSGSGDTGSILGRVGVLFP